MGKWTPVEIALLGTAQDETIAKLVGRTKANVQAARTRYGIPARRTSSWTPEEIQLLGKMPDKRVAKLVNRSGPTVAQKRVSLGIPPSRLSRNRVSTDQTMIVCNYRLPVSLAKRIKRAAHQQGCTISQLVRAMLEDGLKAEEARWNDRAQDNQTGEK